MKTENNMIPVEKLPYLAPMVDVIQLELECSIVTGSATVKPQDYHQDVYEQWDVDVDDNRSINF
ncbi:hypothetical protein [Sphingobacterium griseoflavum]|uniref:Uncharacterized protein n=1 Tax=Sphingobacterium griseoflavum TaxID=1474952 RepID=A0ABQ3HW63_9SPHI|nr:hypothetical protein [Sphingobacterium griseoflavum]GHE39694.1 hypothetical protein GCM10017764_23720 [Sphingobacterium griseoflavum]